MPNQVKYEVVPLLNNSAFIWRRFRFSSFNVKWHAHPEYEIIYFKKASGKILVGNRLYTLLPGELTMIGPNVPHLFKEESLLELPQGADCYVIHIAKDFLTEAQQHYGQSCNFVLKDTVRKTVEGADIVIATTPSREPLVLEDMLSHGMHITSVGSDAFGKEELDPLILKRGKFVIDDWEQMSHVVHVKAPLLLQDRIITRMDVWAEIGEIVAGKKLGRTSEQDITVFTSTGLAVQDAVTAKIAYDKALKKGIGHFIKIV